MTPLFDDKLNAFVGRMAGDIATPFGGTRRDQSRRGSARRTTETPFNPILEARL